MYKYIFVVLGLLVCTRIAQIAYLLLFNCCMACQTSRQASTEYVLTIINTSTACIKYVQVIMAAELQLVAAQGAAETPFVTVKVTVDSEGNAHFDAFQVSLQCMEMVAEGVLEISDNPGSCKVLESFTAVVEAKPTKEVTLCVYCVFATCHAYELTCRRLNARLFLCLHLQ